MWLLPEYSNKTKKKKRKKKKRKKKEEEEEESEGKGVSWGEKSLLTFVFVFQAEPLPAQSGEDVQYGGLQTESSFRGYWGLVDVWSSL